MSRRNYARMKPISWNAGVFGGMMTGLLIWTVLMAIFSFAAAIYFFTDFSYTSDELSISKCLVSLFTGITSFAGNMFIQYKRRKEREQSQEVKNRDKHKILNNMITVTSIATVLFFFYLVYYFVNFMYSNELSLNLITGVFNIFLIGVANIYMRCKRRKRNKTTFGHDVQELGG